MEARAIAKFIRVSPRKARMVVDLVRGKKLEEALAILRYTPNKAADVVTKVVKSAAANAEHNYEMDKDDLVISQIFVDQGPSLKRVMPRAMGRADIIKRKTSHITVVVSDQKEG
ncbi:50S ribosomal protein L22 [Desulforamulus aeronauticus]|uniref:Large ribosomal subunit protein uL22 n=1 Tax=Desulforamulus aeronauticus DSM 10349 TaxID=1121421 RepID=A0A1M6QKF8_9FIRM|nr:50S ribosomal protein L22 [Desulforamulus aeronauticus]SHK20517.1 large subunit ribosomal protein L22 [Desulforamulus aeronauticus DSM 10349]